MTTIRIDEARTLADVDEDAWQTLARESTFYLSYRWLKLVEADPGASATYLLAVDGQGALVGALPCYRVRDESNAFYRPQDLEVLTDLVADPAACLLLGARRGYQSDLLVSPGLDQQGCVRVCAALLDAAVERAQPGAALLLYATERCRRAIAEARPGAQALLLAPEASIEVRGPSFEEHVTALPRRGLRRRTRSEVRDFRSGGYDVGRERFSECWEEAVPLLANVQARYGHSVDMEALRASLRRQAEIVGERGIVSTCRRNGRLVAFSLTYPWGHTLYDRMVGFDYEALSGHSEYFNLAFHQPLSVACDESLRYLHLGIEGYEAKVLRGAELQPLWAIFPDAVCPQEEARRRSEAGLAGFREGLSRVPYALQGPQWDFGAGNPPESLSASPEGQNGRLDA